MIIFFLPPSDINNQKVFFWGIDKSWPVGDKWDSQKIENHLKNSINEISLDRDSTKIFPKNSQCSDSAQVYTTLRKTEYAVKQSEGRDIILYCICLLNSPEGKVCIEGLIPLWANLINLKDDLIYTLDSTSNDWFSVGDLEDVQSVFITPKDHDLTSFNGPSCSYGTYYKPFYEWINKKSFSSLKVDII